MEVYVGGAAGASVRKGDLLATVDSPEAVLELTGRFLQYYRENANWLERTYDFVPRIGLDRLKEVLLEDSDGIVADLDAGMQRRSTPTPTRGARTPSSRPPPASSARRCP